MKLTKLTVLFVAILIGAQSCDLCPGDKPVITFVNNGFCNCDVTITDSDTRYILGGQSIEVSLHAGSYDLSANCNSNAYLNDQLTTLEQIACDLNFNWSTSVEVVCGDEHTFIIN